MSEKKEACATAGRGGVSGNARRIAERIRRRHTGRDRAATEQRGATKKSSRGKLSTRCSVLRQGHCILIASASLAGRLSPQG